MRSEDEHLSFTHCTFSWRYDISVRGNDFDVFVFMMDDSDREVLISEAEAVLQYIIWAKPADSADLCERFTGDTNAAKQASIRSFAEEHPHLFQSVATRVWNSVAWLALHAC